MKNLSLRFLKIKLKERLFVTIRRPPYDVFREISIKEGVMQTLTIANLMAAHTAITHLPELFTSVPGCASLRTVAGPNDRRVVSVLLDYDPTKLGGGFICQRIKPGTKALYKDLIGKNPYQLFGEHWKNWVLRVRCDAISYLSSHFPRCQSKISHAISINNPFYKDQLYEAWMEVNRSLLPGSFWKIERSMQGKKDNWVQLQSIPVRIAEKFLWVPPIPKPPYPSDTYNLCRVPYASTQTPTEVVTFNRFSTEAATLPHQAQEVVILEETTRRVVVIRRPLPENLFYHLKK